MKKITILLSAVIFCLLPACEQSSPVLSDGSLTFSICNSLKSTAEDEPTARIIWQEGGQLLVEMQNTEFCCGTEAISINRAGEGNAVSCEIIDEGPYTRCLCQHDLSFMLEDFRKGSYTLTLIESSYSSDRDTFYFAFDYDEDLDLLISPGTGGLSLSDFPLCSLSEEKGGCNGSLKGVDEYEIEKDTVIFTGIGDSLSVFIGLMATCCGEYSMGSRIESDTLFLDISLENVPLCDCICYYTFSYLFDDYLGQTFPWVVSLDGMRWMEGTFIP